MKRHDSIVIKKMITYCDQIDEMMDRFGAEETMFNTDYAYQYAVGMCIIQIGELVTRLTSNIVLDYPSIPWKKVRAMRNLYAHDDERIDTVIIWSTITKDIPELKAQLTEILESAEQERE